ncbi:MAG: HAD family hydrolase [Candidatus Hodarchaeota archaeon]
MKKEFLNENLKAILFDLDGTLIDVDLKLFIPEYLNALANFISHLVPKRKIVPKLLKASEAINNNNGEKTNEEIFIETFFPFEGYTRDDIQPLFDEFYETKFLNLKQYTKQKPEARAVVQAVFDKGFDVVIATTPVLPLTAIQQRLEWAGVGDFPYKLVTSIENSRANKPNLTYYKNIAYFLGHSPKECLMVGDEDKDMIAAKLGYQTFLVNSSNTEIDIRTPAPTYEGTLNDLKKLIS